MLIKISQLKEGQLFMLRSEGASTIYKALKVTKVTECVTKILSIGGLSNRKKTFIKTNSVRVITFDYEQA